MQGVADEPADGDVDASLTQELAIVHDPEQQPGEHQSYGNFGIDPRPAITMAIAIDDFLPKPGKIEHAADPSQHVIIGDELAERARDEQLQLIPFLPPQHVAPLHPRIVGNTESVFSNFFNDPTRHDLDAYRKLTETLREAGYRPICNSYISEEFQNQRPITSGKF
jgi:hypothetical protein